MISIDGLFAPGKDSLLWYVGSSSELTVLLSASAKQEVH